MLQYAMILKQDGVDKLNNLIGTNDVLKICVNPDCDPTEHYICEFLMGDRQSDCPICKYEIRAVNLDTVKTFSTIYKPNEKEK